VATAPAAAATWGRHPAQTAPVATAAAVWMVACSAATAAAAFLAGPCLCRTPARPRAPAQPRPAPAKFQAGLCCPLAAPRGGSSRLGRCWAPPPRCVAQPALLWWRDMSSVALTWFNNVRVPAALIATASTRLMFMGEGKNSGHASDILRAIYFVCMAGTATSELAVVYVATLGASKVLTGSEPHVASCGLTLLMRGFELEYLLCRVLLLLGIILLLAGLAVRAVLNYCDLPREGSQGERRALLASFALFLSLPPALVAYADMNAPSVLRPELVGLPTFGAICARAVQLLVGQLLVSNWGRFALLGFTGALALAAWAGAALLPSRSPGRRGGVAKQV